MKSKISDDDLLRSILASAFNGIMAFKSIRNDRNEITDFQWIFVNDVACEIIGKPESDLIGTTLLAVLPGTQEAGLFDKYKRVVETGSFSTFEQYYSAENINKWFKISAVKLNDGLTVTFQDISDLKHAVMEIQTKSRKYQRLFEESLDAIFVANDNLVFLDTNSTFQSLFVYDKDELICMSLEHLFASPDQFNMFSKIFLDQGKVEEFEVDLLDKNGREMQCLINCARLTDEETHEKSFIGVIRDLTKKKRADRELIIAEKLSMTGKIARTIAHEVRNPLTNLTLAMEQLKDEIAEDSEDAELFFNIIERNSNRIGQLISDLLNSSKPKELSLKAQNINEVVNGALNLVKDRLTLKNMQLNNDFATEIPQAYLDADQLKIALLNLMINAIEAMQEGKGILSVKTYAKHDDVFVEITDNGTGMTKESLKKLFEPFFTSKSEGTGLGLVTVQNIVQSHKGDITAQSEPNVGTTFIIHLPLPT